MAKRALLAGCNYPGTESVLKGCVNDVNAMRTILTRRFGFHEADIVVLVDTVANAEKPTHANILSRLRGHIAGAKSGDNLVFHFSGHGTQIPDEAGEEDDSGYDEAIVPTDYNILTDDDFRDLVKQIPEGVKFTFIADSCHSGGLIDGTECQIGDVEARNEQVHSSVPKQMSAEALARRLSELSGQTVEKASIRSKLFDIFGEDASLTVQRFPNPSGTVYRPRSQRTQANSQDVGILLSGCQSNELSSDMNPTENPADAYGAFTRAIETVLGQSERPVTNRDIIVRTRNWLTLQGIQQNPCLYCSDGNADAVFICEQV